MMKYLKKYALTLIGIMAGALAGFFYWRVVGCNSGSCSITSSPVNSTIYGSIMGGLVFSLFQKNKTREV